jgi:hypothetical protein
MYHFFIAKIINVIDDPSIAFQNSKAIQARLNRARTELMQPDGKFSEALESLVTIVRSTTDKKGDQIGHGIEALDAILQRLHMPSVNPLQVQTEIAIRLADASNQAKDLSSQIIKGEICTPQKDLEADITKPTTTS